MWDMVQPHYRPWKDASSGISPRSSNSVTNPSTKVTGALRFLMAISNNMARRESPTISQTIGACSTACAPSQGSGDLRGPTAKSPCAHRWAISLQQRQHPTCRDARGRRYRPRSDFRRGQGPGGRPPSITDARLPADGERIVGDLSAGQKSFRQGAEPDRFSCSRFRACAALGCMAKARAHEKIRRETIRVIIGAQQGSRKSRFPCLIG
jgi:hypothetical protein